MLHRLNEMLLGLRPLDVRPIPAFVDGSVQHSARMLLDLGYVALCKGRRAAGARGLGSQNRWSAGLVGLRFIPHDRDPIIPVWVFAYFEVLRTATMQPLDRKSVARSIDIHSEI
jgi:hypothetical protein